MQEAQAYAPGVEVVQDPVIQDPVATGAQDFEKWACDSGPQWHCGFDLPQNQVRVS